MPARWWWGRRYRRGAVPAPYGDLAQRRSRPRARSRPTPRAPRRLVRDRLGDRRHLGPVALLGGLLLGAVYALFSSGLTLVWGMMNVVNFAHGDFVMLGMYVAFVVWTVLGVGPFVGAPAAALVLATLGIIIYFGLIRSVMKGPMLAQILGTFGLALLLRYSVFWGFGANFLTLPADLVGGTYDVLGIKLQASRLLAGITDTGCTPCALPDRRPPPLPDLPADEASAPSCSLCLYHQVPPAPAKASTTTTTHGEALPHWRRAAF